MSRERAVRRWRRVASLARFGSVALAVGLLVIAMLGSIAVGILVALAVIGTVVGG